MKKLISGLLVMIIGISVISCCAKVTETETLAETSEETTTQSTPIEAETEGHIETETSKEEVAETPEEEIIPEKYFTYKVKYQERHGQAVLITDESFPGTLRISLSDDLPSMFFEEGGCKTSEECFNEVIEGILDSLEGKKIILRDTQRGLPKFCYVDTTKPVELVFKFVQTKDQEIGPLYLPLWDEELGIPYESYGFVQRQDKGLRFIVYESPKGLEDILNSPRERYTVSSGLYWMALILKFHPEILGWDQIDPGKTMAWERSPEEENFFRKIHQWPEEQEEPGLLYLAILILKGER